MTRHNKEVFFIVSSGRCGSAMLHKVFSSVQSVEMHHEYMVHAIQPLAVRRYMGLVSDGETLEILRAHHGAAAHYADAKHWGDSSNKLSWLIPDLLRVFPEAKFVHLVRDGRKVAGSYFRKLGAECYDDRSVTVFRNFVEHSAIAPPPEKKYWWPISKNGDPRAEEFARYDQFSRIAWHWAEINRTILGSLEKVAAARKHFVRLEELCANPQRARGLLEFLNIPYQDVYFEMLQKPHNVNRPEDALLSDSESAAFSAVTGDMMEMLGYGGTDEYVVKY